jgi:hypothetical protein
MVLEAYWMTLRRPQQVQMTMSEAMQGEGKWTH